MNHALPFDQIDPLEGQTMGTNVQLARREERDAITEFSEEYLRHTSRTQVFFLHFSSSAVEKVTTKKPDEHFGGGYNSKK